MLRGALLVAFAFAVVSHDHAAVDAAAWRVPLERHVAREMATRDQRSAVWEPAFPPIDRAPVPLNVSVEDGFSATFYFGSPPQPASVLLNIQSNDALVLNHAIGGRKFYDHTKSSTYQPNGTDVALDQGTPVELDGFLSNDHVSVGAPDTSDRIDVRGQTLIEIVGPVKTFEFLGPHFSGEVGLGLGRSPTTGAPSLARAMVDQGLLDRPEIGVSFDKHDAHALFGGIDAAYERSDVHYFSLDSMLWSAPIRGISVEDKQLVGNVGNVMLCYWPFIIGPKSAIEAIGQAVGVKNDELPCDGTGPDIVLQLGPGLNISLTKEDYAPEVRPGVCKFMFVTVGVDQWMLGLPFLQSVYTVLELGDAEGHERIGFAKLKRN